jgi:hypothetical protein
VGHPFRSTNEFVLFGRRRSFRRDMSREILSGGVDVRRQTRLCRIERRRSSGVLGADCRLRAVRCRRAQRGQPGLRRLHRAVFNAGHRSRFRQHRRFASGDLQNKGRSVPISRSPATRRREADCACIAIQRRHLRRHRRRIHLHRNFAVVDRQSGQPDGSPGVDGRLPRAGRTVRAGTELTAEGDATFGSGGYSDNVGAVAAAAAR